MRFRLVVLLSSLTTLLCGSVASATPFLPADIFVGATISGSFSYDSATLLSGSPAGQYDFAGISNQFSLTVGTIVFSGSSAAPNARVRVTDAPAGTPGQADFIQISSNGDSASFSPYLDGFVNQNASLLPRGELLISFHFPNTYLSDNALPLLFDPLQTIGPIPGSSFPNIYGQVEGVSTQSPNSGTREWAFFFEVTPSNAVVSRNGTVTTGTFRGYVTGVDDRTNMTTPVSAVPEPSTLLLTASGILLTLRRRARRR